jgi:UDP-2-acetamido-3-amino-2,3-dideoxy-glucuronate N-acetyltransferase
MAMPDSFIHPSSIIDPGAQIGPGTSVWHFCHIRGSAIIGKSSSLGQNTYIDQDVVIGDRVKIQNNVSVYQGVRLADDVFVGPSVVFTNVINPRSFISRRHEFKATWVETGASLGANATILAGVTIGAYALVGAGAVVLNNVPAFAVVVGNPARQSGWVSKQGTKLDFSKGQTCSLPDEEGFYTLQEDRVIFSQ